MLRCAREFENPFNLNFMFELSLFKLLVWVAWGGVAVWLFIALITLWGLAQYKPLQPLAQSEELRPSSAPLVSILVPARNEEGRVSPPRSRQQRSNLPTAND